MRFRLGLLVWIAVGLGTAAGAEGPQVADFEASLRAYEADDHAVAASGFAAVIESSDDAALVERSVYLLTTLLLYQEAAPVEQLVADIPGLDAGLLPVLTGVRGKRPKEAARALAFLQFREEALPRTTRLLLPGLRTRIGPAEGDYAVAWERELAHAADLSVDSKGRLWALVTEPPSFVAIERSGEVSRRVPFVPVDALGASELRRARFVARPDGGFQLGAHRYDAEGRHVASIRVQPPEDVAPLDATTTVMLHEDGLRAVGADGGLSWQRLGRGRRSGSFSWSVALALDESALFVAEKRRVQRFSRGGEFEAAVDDASLAPGGTGIRLRDIGDVAAADGRVFVGHTNARRVDVLGRGLEAIGSFAMPSRRIAAGEGMVFGLKDERLFAAFAVPPDSRAEAERGDASGERGGSPRQDGRREPAPGSWQVERIDIEWARLEPPPAGVRVHGSVRFTTSLAASAESEGGVWIGSYGGLMHWSPAQGPWQQWNRTHGLPSDVVHDVFETPGGDVYAITNGAVLRRRPGESGWSRLMRGGSPVNGKGLAGEPGSRGVVWVAAQRGVLRLDPASPKAAFVPIERGAEELAWLPERRLLVRLGVDGVGRIDVQTGELTVLLEMEDLRRVPGVRAPGADHWILTLSADPASGLAWVGSDRRELFALDPETGKLTGEWIDGALRPGCQRGEIRARRVGGILHLPGAGCHLLRDPTTGRARVVFEHAGRGQDLIEIGDRLLLATTEGLHRLDARGRHEAVEPGLIAPPGWAPRSLAQVEGRIWVGHGSHGIGIYDGTQWREIEAASSVDRLRVRDDDVLAIASYGQGRAFVIDRDGARAEPLALGGFSFRALRDLHHDGRTWWAAGSTDPRRANGIRVLGPAGEEHWGREQGMPFGEVRRILPDPRRSERLWLATDVGLVRLDKQTRLAEVVWPGDVDWLACFDGRFLWARGSGLLRFDTHTGLGSPFPVSGLPAPDPDDASVVWVASQDRLVRLDVESGRVLGEHPLGLGSLAPYGLEILADPEGYTAWVAGFHGLVEVRIPRAQGAASLTED